jgi:hypothetical protein
MITLSKIKNDAKGTIVGRFLKNTGGGNPKTIGKQIIGQGISLVKDKLRTTLFGNPNSLGTNTAGATDKYEYSSTLPYSKQISNVKFNSKSVSKVDKAATDITKKVTQLQLDAKKKLGEASSNLTASLKQKFKGGNTALDKFLDEKAKERADNSRPYNEKYSSYITSNSIETNLGMPTAESTDTAVKDSAEIGKAKEKLGKNATSVKDKLKGTESKPEIDKAVEAKTKTTTATPKTYSEKLGNYTNENISERIDLKLVSPVYGIDRRGTNGVFGTSPYAFKDIKNNTGAVMPNDPTNPYSGVAGGQNITTIETQYGITSNNGDLINSSYGVSGVGNGDDKDLVTFSIAGVSDSKKVYFRTLITSLSETVTPSWDSAKFVGNPYSYYTYGGVERTLSLQLKMYCMNSNELSTMWQRIQFLTGKAYPTIDKNNLVNPPFIEFWLGNMYQKKTAFINSLSYTFPDDGTWETANGNQLPKIVEVQMEFKFVENVGAELKLYGTPVSKEAVKVINKRKAEQSGNTNTVSEEPKTGGSAPTTNNGGVASAPQVVQPATPPAPINSVGVPQTEPPKTESTSGGMLGVDSTPKSLETGEPAETPKESIDPALLAAIIKKSETRAEELRKEAYTNYKDELGIPDLIAARMADEIALGSKISDGSIEKATETAYYAPLTYKGQTSSRDMCFFINKAGVAVAMRYNTWFRMVNNGVNPLKEQGI